ncbi:MAG TPA: TorF family putative porin [Burkholderiales bacterium]|nr:TorF family putative porin [Burkholderiales bacterium]
MKQLLMAGAVCAAIAAPISASAQATAAPAAPASPHTVTGNFSIVSDYRFRGLSQTDRGPALQGGIDYSHESGFYLGNWNSSVDSGIYTDGSGIEMDFYGGFKPVFGDVTLDIGALYYYYPQAENGDGDRFNTLEAYVGAAYGPISGKIWYGVGSKWFASEDAAHSIYYEVNGTFPLVENLSLAAHVGYQDVKDVDDADYWDFKLGLTYDLSGWLLGAAVVATNADDDVYGHSGDTTVVVSVGKTF